MASNPASITSKDAERSPGAATSPYSRELLKKSASNELFFAVIGPVGAGCSRAADSLKRALEAATFAGKRYQTAEIIKASDLIRVWATNSGKVIPQIRGGFKTLEYQTEMQKLGDDMREDNKDAAAVAIACIGEIAHQRGVAGPSIRPSNSSDQ